MFRIEQIKFLFYFESINSTKLVQFNEKVHVKKHKLDSE